MCGLLCCKGRSLDEENKCLTISWRPEGRLFQEMGSGAKVHTIVRSSLDGSYQSASHCHRDEA
jgi:hypothetical protein